MFYKSEKMLLSSLLTWSVLFSVNYLFIYCIFGIYCLFIRFIIYLFYLFLAVFSFFVFFVFSLLIVSLYFCYFPVVFHCLFLHLSPAPPNPLSPVSQLWSYQVMPLLSSAPLHTTSQSWLQKSVECWTFYMESAVS